MAGRSAADPVAPDPSNSRMTDRQTLDRVTFRATDDQLAALESLVDAGVYRTRSEAIRAALQRLLEHHTDAERDTN